MSEVVARHVVITGRVQAVAFRWSTREAARRMGIAGWVRNLPDGSVEAFVQGETDTVERMLVWLGRGPPPASVEHVEVAEQAPAELDGFEIRETPTG